MNLSNTPKYILFVSSLALSNVGTAKSPLGAAPPPNISVDGRTGAGKAEAARFDVHAKISNFVFPKDGKMTSKDCDDDKWLQNTLGLGEDDWDYAKRMASKDVSTLREKCKQAASDGAAQALRRDTESRKSPLIVREDKKDSPATGSHTQRLRDEEEKRQQKRPKK